MTRCIALVLLFWSLPAFTQTLVVTVTNPSPFSRSHETIALRAQQVQEVLGRADQAFLRLVRSRDAVRMPVQVLGEEVLFQCDLGPRKSERFELSLSPDRLVPLPSVVSGMFVVPRQDYAWENDRIAFRVYGPALAAEVNNGIDVWTKRVPYPIVAKWYKESETSMPGKDSYHEDNGEGADYFSVGRTLGAGSAGLWQNGSVLQPGVFTGWKTLASGPVRVAFRLTYAWVMDGDTLLEERTIALDAGENMNRIEVRFTGAVPAGAQAVAAGLVKRAGVAVAQHPGRQWLALWGPTNPDPRAGSLGTAVLFPVQAATAVTEDKDQHLLVGALQRDTAFTYYAGAGWTGNGQFRTAKDWTLYLDNFLKRVEAPLRVVITRKP